MRLKIKKNVKLIAQKRGVATYNVKVMDLHCLITSASSMEPLQVVHRVDFHGPLLHLPIDTHAVMDIVHLQEISQSRAMSDRPFERKKRKKSIHFCPPSNFKEDFTTVCTVFLEIMIGAVDHTYIGHIRFHTWSLNIHHPGD